MLAVALLISPMWGFGVGILSLIAFAFLANGLQQALPKRRFGRNLRPGIVGNPGPFADGTAPYNSSAREGKTRETVVGQAHGKYYEAASRGVLFAACEQGTGVTHGTALGTTAFFALYNPAGSGKRLAIKKVSVGYISGTLGAGTMYHCIDKTLTQAAPSAGTALTSVCSDIGNSSSSVGLARVNCTVASTLVAYRPFLSIAPDLATTVNPLTPAEEDVDGEIVVEPGCSYQLQSVCGAAGTSPKMTVGVTWEEVPVV